MGVTFFNHKLNFLERRKVLKKNTARKAAYKGHKEPFSTTSPQDLLYSQFGFMVNGYDIVQFIYHMFLSLLINSSRSTLHFFQLPFLI